MGGALVSDYVSTFFVVFNNDPWAGYCWFLRATLARAHHLRGVFGGVGWMGTPEASCVRKLHLSGCIYQ